jgi:N-acetylmuramoyl-L-alanine amidase
MTNDYINDPGHGGSDPGAVHSGNIEKVYTLEAGLYVDKRLEEHGIKSSMTRTTDKTLDPEPRTAIVRNSGVKRGLSHHYNAGGGTGAEFIHSIYSDGKLEAIMADEFKKAGFPVRRIFDRQLSSGKDYYYMHRETGAVAVTIIEYDFVDGGNREKIKSKEYRVAMYEAVIRAICRFEGVTYKPLNQPKPQPKGDEDMLENAIVIFGDPDYFNAKPMASRLKAGVFTRDTLPAGKVSKTLYAVGGADTKGLEGKADKIVHIGGADRYEVAKNIKAFLSK